MKAENGDLTINAHLLLFFALKPEEHCTDHECHAQALEVSTHSLGSLWRAVSLAYDCDDITALLLLSAEFLCGVADRSCTNFH